MPRTRRQFAARLRDWRQQRVALPPSARRSRLGQPGNDARRHRGPKSRSEAWLADTRQANQPANPGLKKGSGRGSRGVEPPSCCNNRARNHGGARQVVLRQAGPQVPGQPQGIARGLAGRAVFATGGAHSTQEEPCHTGLKNAHALESQTVQIPSRHVEHLRHYPQMEARLRQHPGCVSTYTRASSRRPGLRKSCTGTERTSLP